MEEKYVTLLEKIQCTKNHFQTFKNFIKCMYNSDRDIGSSLEHNVRQYARRPLLKGLVVNVM